MRKLPTVSYTPRHRRNWRRLGRWCTCGLSWPCPDRYTTVRAVAPAPHWSAPTDMYPSVGRAPLLTRAGRWRAAGSAANEDRASAVHKRMSSEQARDRLCQRISDGILR